MVSSGRRQAPRRGGRNLPRHHCSRVTSDPAPAEKVPEQVWGRSCGHSQKTKSAAVSPTSAHIEAKLLASMSVLDVATSAKFFKVSSVISTRIDSAATFSNGDLPIHVASNAPPPPPPPPPGGVLDLPTSAKFLKVAPVISARNHSAATFPNGDLPIHGPSNAAPSPPSTRSRVATPSDFVWPAQLTIP